MSQALDSGADGGRLYGGGGSSPGQGVAACGCKIGFNSENKFPVAFFIRHLNEEMSIYSVVSTIYTAITQTWF